MPLTTQERNWLERAEEAANNPELNSEGVSVRIVVYLLRQIVTLREQVAELDARVTDLEGS